MKKSRRIKFFLSILMSIVMLFSVVKLVLVNAEQTLPSVPANFQAKHTITSVTLTWDEVTGAKEYEIEVDGKIISNGTKKSYVHDNLLAGSEHTYRVRVKDKNGTSNWSVKLNVKTQLVAPFVPSNFKITNVTNTSIAMIWDASLGANSYEIETDGKVISNESKNCYTQNDLQPSSKHTYRVRAKNDVGGSNWSSGYEVTTYPNPPNTPDNLKISNISGDNIVLVWDKVAGADGYDILVDNKLVDNGSSNSFTHTKAASNTEHTYFVRAKNAGGLSDWSKGVGVSSAAKQKVLPASPSNIRIAATENSLSVTWDSVANANKYYVEVDGKINDVSNNKSFVINGLLPATNHTFRFRSEGNDGMSSWSNPITCNTLLGVPKSINSIATANSIVLTWTPVEGATAYDIEIDGVVTDNGAKSTYMDSNLQSNSSHSYRVRAKSDKVTGDWSDVIKQTTLQNK